MGLLTDILKKAKEAKSPYLNISRDQLNELRKGTVLEIPDTKTGENYLVWLEREKIGSQNISKEDLVIEPATPEKAPNVAKAPPETNL